MFKILGQVVNRGWPLLVAAWVAALILLRSAAPEWKTVITDGEFAFLPADSSSRLGEELFKDAWDQPLASSIVIVVRRESHKDGLLEQDRTFIDEVLKPRLESIVAEESEELAAADAQSVHGAADDEEKSDESSDESSNKPEAPDPRVRTFSDRSIGRLLDSNDNKASLVVVELTTEFFDSRNDALIRRIEALTDRKGELHRKGLVPHGLHLAISGSATVGRDMISAATESSKATEFWTILLVVVLLIAIYRAPVLALIPLLTVAIASEISLAVLALLAKAGIVELFAGIEVYVTVLSYGAGVDYCLFLIARYKEELDKGADFQEAVAETLDKVGAALMASAFTVICGIGMLVFAQFGKFRQAGVGISLGLFIVLCASLTLTPALLRVTGRWAFWPRVRGERLSATAGWISATSLMGRLLEQNHFQAVWTFIGQALLKRPGTILVVSVGLMTPFAVAAVYYYDYLSYGLLSELPQDKPSVIGAKAVQAHFPAGMAGPITLLLKNDEIDFRSNDAIAGIAQLTERLKLRKDELSLADVRDVAFPYGITEAAQEPDAGQQPKLSFAKKMAHMLEEKIRRERVVQHYVSSKDDLAGHITRIDLVFHDDPFSRGSIQRFEELRNTVQSALPEELHYPQPEHVGIKLDATGESRIERVVPATTAANVDLQAGDVITAVNGQSVNSRAELCRALHDAPLKQPLQIGIARSDGDDKTDALLRELQPAENWRREFQTELFAIGPTASIRDLKKVTDSDQIRVDFLVLGGVFLILVTLLRKPAVSAYLILSVFFSYLVTLGVTFAVFKMLDPQGFAGLDWKVPMFLFTILIAVGEDYNIFLMTRIEEEQARHGMVQGVIVALQKTGSIISSCGIIMAGTFSSLLAGSLVGMHQLGFALAFGVLLDTFVVRPILVPAYLILLYSGRLGALGRYLGAGEYLKSNVTANVEVGTVEIGPDV